MKVLLLNGSPHKEGCTNTALCEVANVLNQKILKLKYFISEQMQFLLAEIVELV